MDLPKHYCPKPFNYLYFEGLSGGPCCHWFHPEESYAMASDNIPEMFHSPTMNKIREDMLAGRSVKGCEQCYEEEARGVKSLRQSMIEQYGFITEPKLVGLETSFDNVCNLKCRMCVSFNSHLIKEDEIKIYGKSLSRSPVKYISNQSFNGFDYSELRSMTLFGGEPFMSKRAEEFLVMLKENDYIKNVKFEINTNATIIPSPAFIDALTSSKEAFIMLSIDGYGKLNDYARSGADFNQIMKVIEFYNDLKSKHPNIRMGTNTAVSTYNINKMDELYEFLEVHCPGYEFIRRPVFWPTVMCAQHLPEDYKKQIIEVLKQSRFDFSDLIKLLAKQGEDNFEHFLNYHFKLDQLRDESLAGLNPMLENYINEYVRKNPVRVDSTEYFNKQADVVLK